MKNRPMLASIVLMLLIIAGIGTARTDEQGELLRGDWTVVGPAQSVEEMLTEPDVDQKPAFVITPSSLAGAWVVSQPLSTMTKPVTLSMRVQRRSGSGALAVSLLSDIPESPTQITPLWHLERKEERPHRIEIGLVVPPTKEVRLAIGVVGGEGHWTVENIELSDWTPPQQEPGPLADLPAVTSPQPLPVGWEPEGSLDGRWRTVGDEKEIIATVHGLHISVPAEVTVARGVRHGITTFVSNRGEVEKELTISLQGLPGTYMPTFTVPFAGGGTTFFRPPIQMLVNGKHWVKLTLSSGPETAAIPILVNCETSYPTLGLITDLKSLGDQLKANPLCLAQFLHIRIPQSLLNTVDASQLLPDIFTQVIMALPLGADLSTVLADWDPAQARQLTTLISFYRPESMQQSPGSQTAAQVSAAASQIRSRFSEASFISPALPAVASEEGLQPSAHLAEMLEAGAGKVVNSVAVSLPDLPPAGVLTEKVDGRLHREICSFWADFDSHYDFQPLRQALNAREAHLPMLLAELPTQSTGDARLDALLVGRLLISGFAQGCTGATFSPKSLPQSREDNDHPVLVTLRELSRELTGTTPLWGLAGQTDFSGRIGQPIVYRSFRREAEGIVFLWNNTSQPYDVAVQLQSLPLQMHILRFSYTGEFVSRQFQGLFAFSEEAKENRQQAVYVRVRPLEIVGLTFNLKNPHAGWLGQLTPRPPVKEDYGPTWPTRGTDPWSLEK